ncbi:hypothetical protein Tco_0672698 [Tanacetum coccineum]
MSRTNPQAIIVSREQLVPRANKLVIKINSHRVASDSDITDTMLRFVVGIIRHHKLYKPVSLTTKVPGIYLHQFWTTINNNPNNKSFTFQLDTQTFTLNAGILRIVLQMPSPDTKTPYTKPPIKNQILRFIKTLGYDDDSKAKMTSLSTFVATRLRQPCKAILSVLNRSLTGKYSSWDIARLPILQILCEIVHSANLDFASIICDEFEWQKVDRSTKPSKMSKLLYTHFTKLIIDYFLSCNKNIPCRSNSKMHSEGDDSPITNCRTLKWKVRKQEPEEQNVSPVRSGKGKGYMRSGDNEANVSKIFKKDDVPRKTRSLAVAEERVADKLAKSINTYAEWGQKLKGPVVEDPTVQSLLDLQKGSKANRLESLKQKKQAVAGEGSSVAHIKYDDTSDTKSDVTCCSSCSDTLEESANGTNDADDSDLNLSDDNPDKDDDTAGFGVFMYNKSTETPKSTYLRPTITTSSLDFIQNLLDETPVNELTDLMSNLVYTYAPTTLVVHNLDGNHEVRSFLSCASEVPFVTHVDVQATKLILQEIFLDDHVIFHHKLPTNLQPNSLQAKSKKLMQKAKKNTRKIKFKKAVAQNFREYDQKLKALINFNVSEAFKKAVQTKQPLDAQDAEPSFHKRSHDNQDTLNDRKKEKRKKQRKDVGQSYSRSSRRKKSPMVHAQDDTPAVQSLNPKDEYIWTFPNPEWYTKSGSIDQRSLKQSSRTIADLKGEGAGLERIEQQYQNDVELEYHINQLKATVLSEAKWNSDEDDVVKDIQLGVKSYQQTLNLTKPMMFFEGIDQRIPFTMTATHKGVVYLNQHNIKSQIRLSEVKKSCDGTLVKIRENLIDTMAKNKLGKRNQRLKGRVWIDHDVVKSNEMVKKIDQTLKRRE